MAIARQVEDPFRGLRRYALPQAFTTGYITGLSADLNSGCIEEGMIVAQAMGETFLIKVLEGNEKSLEDIARALIIASRRSICVELFAAEETAEQLYITLAALGGNTGYSGDVRETDRQFSERVLKKIPGE